MRALILTALLFTSMSMLAQNTVVLNPDSAKVTISRMIYGHFAEHLGHCIYGGFYVGEGNKKIPNTNGVRNDVVDALRKLKIPVLRWPGGCFADTYHWKDGIGPKGNRPSIVNTNWGGVTEDNSFGTHEFLNMCKLLGTEPYISGNVGSGTVQELADWVQYTNFDNKSPMSDLRRQNGQQNPWNVKFWGIGNEAWGCGGNMTAEHYANVYRQYATFMTNWNNSDRIFRIASGASGDDYHWTEVLMRDIPLGMLDGVALHHYSVIDWNKKSSATNFTEDQYFKTMQQASLMDEYIRKHTEIMDKYDTRKKVALVVDEWGGWYDVEPGTNGAFLYQQNTMRDAMIAGLTLNIFNNHCDRVRMANLAQCINVLQAVILTNEEKIILTPTYHVMEMYNVHQDAALIPADVNSNDYTSGDKKLKAISASASRDKNGAVHISITNIDAKNPQDVSIDLGGIQVKSITGRILRSGKLQDYNSFEDPNKIKPSVFNDAHLAAASVTLRVPAFSVVVLELK